MKIVKKLFIEKLEVNIQIDSVTLINSSTLRAILHSASDKPLLFSRCHKLKGEKIGITDDLSPFERNQKKRLLPMLQFAKKCGKQAFFRGSSLVIDSVIQKMDFGSLEQSEETHDSVVQKLDFALEGENELEVAEDEINVTREVKIENCGNLTQQIVTNTDLIHHNGPMTHNISDETDEDIQDQTEVLNNAPSQKKKRKPRHKRKIKAPIYPEPTEIGDEIIENNVKREFSRNEKEVFLARIKKCIPNFRIDMLDTIYKKILKLENGEFLSKKDRMLMRKLRLEKPK